jgi:16S rRNA (guanine527-N7)-methyltransferase
MFDDKMSERNRGGGDGAPEPFRLDVSRETRERLGEYERVLRHWQRRTNLVSQGSLNALWVRHFIDSAQLGPLLPSASNSHIVDVGSGAGFPGMVLAILGYGARVSLVESNAKRCQFLREVARQTNITVDVVQGRVEDPGISNHLGDVDIVVARACAPLATLLDLVFPILGHQTCCMFPKGKRFQVELEAALARWAFDIDVLPSCTTAEGRILRMHHVKQRT